MKYTEALPSKLAISRINNLTYLYFRATQASNSSTIGCKTPEHMCFLFMTLTVVIVLSTSANKPV